jgi:CheY-like chemotaxis protein
VEDGRTRPDGTPRVLVVARDAPRLIQYQSALRVAGAPAIATMDSDAAADLLVQHRPAVLVLDQGLPRLVLFRLYGLAREDEGQTPIQVVFVGQDDDTGPDDHYLPGTPSPSRVAVQVTALLSRLDAARAAPPAAAPAPPAAPSPLPASESARSAPAASVSDVPPQARARPVQPPPAAAGPAASANGQTDAAAVAAPEPPTAEATPAAPITEAPKRKGRRLDVMLVRIGLVLLILGGLLFLLQMQVSQGPLVAPTLAPAAPTRRPSPSPSPSPRADLSAPMALAAAAGR